MDYLFKLCLFVAVFSIGFCATISKNSGDENTQVRKSRTSFRDFMVCGLTRDVSCFLDVADVMVQERMTDVLAQADKEALKTTGRADEEHTPSQLTRAITRIISEITEMFKDGLSGFFKSAREGEEDEVEESDEKSDEKAKGKTVGEARKKKGKIKKLIALIKLIVIGIIIKAKITLLLKALSAALQVKFFLVALAGLILNAARFYLDLKKGHHPQKVIYYEHAQHQHHYEGDDEWGSSGPGGGGGYWGRSYDEEEKPSAQDLAYAKQKPYRYVDNDKSEGFSWFG